jgi:hypothetical protein
VTEEHTSTENHGGKNQHAPLLLAQENWLAGEKPGEQKTKIRADKHSSCNANSDWQQKDETWP